ncbi:MAG: putative Peptidase domain protein, involved in ppq synthesis (ppqG) [Deltaproteobacteria bacterium]|nr:putative Peptidase domain protein, involved in ppq synthesis (ppqG) [Deltaproteobacteria bacterium]
MRPQRSTARCGSAHAGIGVGPRRAASRSMSWLATCVLSAWAATAAATPPAARFTLSNGARLVVSEQHALPLVAIDMFIDAGSRRDPGGQEGVAALTADLLTEGTERRSAEEVSRAFDAIGAAYSIAAGVDFATANMKFLSKDLAAGLDLLFDVLLHPRFPEAEVARRREATLAHMKAEEDEPGEVAERAFLKAIFADGPYGHPVIGYPDAVRKLTRKEVAAFYSQNYRPDGTIISVVGDVSASDIRERMEKALRQWQKGTAVAFQYPPDRPATATTVAINKPITQANIVLGHMGIARDNPDYYPVLVMNFILGGGGFSSRLLDNIRTKAGLAYSVASFFTPNKAPGSFQVVMQTKNASTTDAIRRACAEFERIRTEAVGDDELNDARLYLTGSFPLKLDSSAKMASFLTQVEFFNLGDDYTDTFKQRINAVTKDDVRRVAQKYLQPDQLTLVVVSDLSNVQAPTAPVCVETGSGGGDQGTGAGGHKPAPVP